MRSAKLDVILKANGVPTGDELRANTRAEQAQRTEAEKMSFPNGTTGRQRRAYRRMIERNQEQSHAN